MLSKYNEKKHTIQLSPLSKHLNINIILSQNCATVLRTCYTVSISVIYVCLVLIFISF